MGLRLLIETPCIIICGVRDERVCMEYLLQRSLSISMSGRLDYARQEISAKPFTDALDCLSARDSVRASSRTENTTRYFRHYDQVS